VKREEKRERERERVRESKLLLFAAFYSVLTHLSVSLSTKVQSTKTCDTGKKRAAIEQGKHPQTVLNGFVSLKGGLNFPSLFYDISFSSPPNLVLKRVKLLKGILTG
jgi:hypothetical protein